MAVPNLPLDGRRRLGRLASDEVPRRRHEPVALQVRRLAHAHGIALRIEIDDVERPAGREAEPSLLTDGIGRDPPVRAEHTPPLVDGGARPAQLGGAPTQEAYGSGVPSAAE